MIKDSVDLVLTAPPSEVLPVYRPNARRGGPVLEMPQPYDQAAKFVVRTALVRVQGFDRAKRVAVDGPEQLAMLCRHLVHYDQEHLVTVAMDNAMKVLAIHEVGIGTRSSAQVMVADIAKIPLLCSASSTFIVHNHPSGNPLPSDDDRKMFAAAKSQLKCSGFQLLDSMIVAREGYYSLEGGRDDWPASVKEEMGEPW